MSKEDDATRDALQRIARGGSDLGKPLAMDFFVAVPDEAAGRVVAARAHAEGFATKVVRDEPSGRWTCYCSKTIVAEYAHVRGTEHRLDSLAADVGGYCDGFGTFGNVATS